MARPALPDDILDRIAADFDVTQRTEVTEALLALAEVTREPWRVARCVLFVAGGDLGRFREMTELAQADYRDAVVAAEYDRWDGRLRDFSRPFDEAELPPD